MISGVGEATNNSATATRIMASTRMVKCVGRGFISGRMETNTMENGVMGRDTVTEIGKMKMGTLSLVLGSRIWPMDMEYTSGPMATGMKVNGSTR